MLTDKLRLSGPESLDPEDILSSSLGVIFPDDITNQHGDKDTSVIYLSDKFGELEVQVADPKKEDVGLFSHFLWNAGVQVVEFLEGEGDVREDGGEGGSEGGGTNGEMKGKEGREGGKEGRKGEWKVLNERVLELGAGTGLAGLMAGLMGAQEVIITDYPAPEVLSNIQLNINRNITPRKSKPSPFPIAEVRVQGHEWGILDDDFAKENKGKFGRIIVADCLWMPWQHGNLRKSIGWFLKDGEGRAWVVAGFHTGREKMRGFFEEEGMRAEGLKIERTWERNAEGGEREWVEDRGREDVTERKRWLVCAILRKI